MALFNVQAELLVEPLNIIDWVQDEWTTLWHCCATCGALRGEWNSIPVVSQLQLWPNLRHAIEFSSYKGR